MSWLILCALVVVVLAITGTLVSRWQADEGRALEDGIRSALQNASQRLDTALDDALGASVITARMSGLVEFVHGLTSIRDPSRRTSAPAFLFVLAGAIITAAGAYAVFERVEDRRETTACIEAMQTLRSRPEPAVGDDALRRPKTDGDDATTATGRSPSATGAPTTSTTGSAATATTVNPPGSTTTEAPLSPWEASQFLKACKGAYTSRSSTPTPSPGPSRSPQPGTTEPP